MMKNKRIKNKEFYREDLKADLEFMTVFITTHVTYSQKIITNFQKRHENVIERGLERQRNV